MKLIIIHYERKTTIAKHYGMYSPVICEESEVNDLIQKICGDVEESSENPYEEYGVRLFHSQDEDAEYQVSIFDISALPDIGDVCWHVFDLMIKKD